ncbi:hypothetical protein TKWG_09965 [Advenella kashmirensis WT001]|uniref:Uncharacterized protein n=1 Tax=Advenella kashmirensis (strain DSM 17095 / LMG 22695 / WT001) TaxID=1036672 RepID=I3UB91_ADVKW|nr:hypothetical protein [Advenella kashmirensis]AFK62279.1 hypothetical protein TKWG_09965 [Advenella kashmirensis WT001]
MSITFRKRPDHTLSVPEAKEPHLDLHSIDARADSAAADDDIPVLLPEPPASTQSAMGPGATGTPTARQQAGPPDRADSPMPVQQPEHTGGVHIPAPPLGPRPQSPAQNTPAWQEQADDMPVLMPTQRPAQVPPFGASASPRPAPPPYSGSPSAAQAGVGPGRQPDELRHGKVETTQATGQSGTAPSSPTSAPSSSPLSGAGGTSAPSSAFPGHPTPDDYAPFLSTARATHGHHSKPELYVWSDDENDAFSQAAQGDFKLNRIQPTAGRPTFDASLFRAPSRPDALAATAAPTASGQGDTAADMQAEIDALVTELLDESHEYLKRRLLEEIPEIIAKYRHDQ